MIEGLDTLVTLESLFLGKNKIEKIQVCVNNNKQTNKQASVFSPGFGQINPPQST